MEYNFFLPADTPPKRGAEVILPPPSPVSTETDYKTEESQAELRLLDEEIMQEAATENHLNNGQATKNHNNIPNNTPKTTEITASFKCQIVMAILALLALIPLIGIVIYLVGMFWKVPSTLTMTS